MTELFWVLTPFFCSKILLIPKKDLTKNIPIKEMLDMSLLSINVNKNFKTKVPSSFPVIHQINENHPKTEPLWKIRNYQQSYKKFKTNFPECQNKIKDKLDKNKPNTDKNFWIFKDKKKSNKNKN